MEPSIRCSSANVQKLKICLDKMKSKIEKKYRENTIREIMKNLTALLNSSGGTLLLIYENPQENCAKHLTRMIEQRMQELTTCLHLCAITMEPSPSQLVIILNGAKRIITLNYNLYLASESQVMTVPSSEPIENIKMILNKKPITPSPTKANHSHFVQGQFVCESKKAVHKLLKEEPTKNVTIADRMIINKLESYVSAFANSCGGAIYYGINENGSVVGQRITKRDQDIIVKKVTKTVTSMVWPDNCGKRGTDWDISFYPVVDHDGNHILSTYVIVIFIFECPGGVFTAEPECYHIENDVVVQTNFHSWKYNIMHRNTSIVLVDIPRQVPRVRWSSAKDKKIYSEVTTMLVHYRNENMLKKFDTFSQLVVSRYPESDASLVVTSEKFEIALKQHKFKYAHSLVRDFEESLQKSANNFIFQVRLLYMKSRIERAEGNYKESYEIAKEAIPKVKEIPTEYMTVWFYVHAATVAMALSSFEEWSSESCKLREEAKGFLHLAQRITYGLDESPEKVWDLQQKLHIYTACVLLGCSLTGENIGDEHVTDKDLGEAKSSLMSVQKSFFETKLPTQLRRIQYVLVESDLYYRYGNSDSKINQFQNLKRAFELANEGKSLARECRFHEMVHYAMNRLKYITEQLIRFRIKDSSAVDDFEKCVKHIDK